MYILNSSKVSTVFSLQRTSSLLLAAAIATGCSSARSRDAARLPDFDYGSNESMAPSPGPAPAPTPAPNVQHVAANPKDIAAAFPRPADCEKAARQQAEVNPELGWAILKACVDRGNFTALHALARGDTWAKFLQTKPEAPLLLAMIVSARGGDIEGDLSILRRLRVPLFTLGAALAQPEVYRGRYVLMRAKTGETRFAAGKPTVMVAEVSLRAHTSEQEVGTAWHVTRKSSGRANVKATSSRYGSAAAKGDYERESTSRYARTVQRHDNVQTETGRQAMLRLVQPDPFLESGREFVFLVRFDGMRRMASDESEESVGVGVVSLVKYLEPSALLIE